MKKNCFSKIELFYNEAENPPGLSPAYDEKYCLYDANGTLVFRFHRDVFKADYHAERSYTYPVFKIGVVVSGSADWYIRDKMRLVEAGDILILRANTLRHIDRINSDGFVCDMYSFIPSFISGQDDSIKVFYAESSDDNVIIRASDPNSAKIAASLGLIRDELKNDGEFCRDMVCGMLITTLVYINRALNFKSPENSYKVTSRADSDVFFDYFDKKNSFIANSSMNISKNSSITMAMVNVSDYINTHISEKINITELAKLANMSRSSFYNYFRDYFGITVNSYIQRCRIQRTITILLNTDCNILVAAYRCGFRSNSNFYDAFNNIVGMSPRDYIYKIKQRGKNEN